MNSRKTKITWKEVCRTKQRFVEQNKKVVWVYGLLKEMNVACVLKLLWRILSANLLWISWIKLYLIRKGSLCSVKNTLQLGS